MHLKFDSPSSKHFKLFIILSQKHYISSPNNVMNHMFREKEEEVKQKNKTFAQKYSFAFKLILFVFLVFTAFIQC